jgi:trehalose synthase
MVAPLCGRGLRVVWRCHVGVDEPNNHVHGAWDFLRPYVDPAEVVAGPNSGGVSDDPEGATVYEEVKAVWQGLDDEDRRRAHLVSLPMHDIEENGAMVNAIQRRADVVVQKSIAEGFGLTASRPTDTSLATLS